VITLLKDNVSGSLDKENEQIIVFHFVQFGLTRLVFAGTAVSELFAL